MRESFATIMKAIVKFGLATGRGEEVTRCA